MSRKHVQATDCGKYSIEEYSNSDGSEFCKLRLNSSGEIVATSTSRTSVDRILVALIIQDQKCGESANPVYEAEPWRPKFRFELNQKQEEEFLTWKAKIKDLMGSEGSFEFRFRPNAIGEAVEIWSSELNRVLDVSHEEVW